MVVEVNSDNFLQIILPNFVQANIINKIRYLRSSWGVKMDGFITVEEAAKKWGITPRQVQILCKAGRIKGVSRMSRIWIIPKDAQKPTKDGSKSGGK